MPCVHLIINNINQNKKLYVYLIELKKRERRKIIGHVLVTFCKKELIYITKLLKGFSFIFIIFCIKIENYILVVHTISI